jgi:hypothetical protein
MTRIHTTMLHFSFLFVAIYFRRKMNYILHTMVPPTARAMMINDDHTDWNASAKPRVETVQKDMTVRISVMARIEYLNRMIKICLFSFVPTSTVS